MIALPNVLLFGLIGLLGFFCQWLAWRVKLPAILFFLLLGIALGPGLGVLDPDALFGELLFPFVSLSVAIILFEGSLTLKHVELKEIGRTVRNLVTYGALVNTLITTLAAHYFVGMDWSLAALFGVIMMVTGPTVIVPMLRTVKPNARIAKTLRWEGIVIDPLGALLAVLVFEWILAHQTSSNLSNVVVVFSETIATGVIAGITFGYALGLLLRHHLIPEFLQNFATIAFVAIAFALSDTIKHESGLLTVTIMGIWLANMPDVFTRDILNFKESLTLMFVSVLFIVLSARVDFSALFSMGWAAVGVLLAVQFLARPAKVFISCLGSDFSLNERLLLAWIGPRGIVAAAVAAVFALKLDTFEIAGGDLMVPLAFSVIIGTVLIQSATAKPLARFLNVNESNTRGFLIIGANPVAREIARALDSVGVRTRLCDKDWSNISAARMAGLDTYYGNPISDHADLHLDIESLGGMLGLSAQSAENVSASLRFREDFGSRRMYVLASAEDQERQSKHRTSHFYRGRILFGADVTYGKLRMDIARGATIKSTPLSDTYDYQSWQEDPQNRESIPLFATDTKDRLHWVTTDAPLEPKSGWRIYALAKPSPDTPPAT